MLYSIRILRRIIPFVVTLAFLLTACAGFPDGRIYVDRNASGSTDGGSWSDAFTNLPDALEAARSGRIKEIWIAAGTYYTDEGAATDRNGTTLITPNNDRNATFFVTEGIKIYGGFAGGETSLSQRNFAANIVTLSGDIDRDNTFSSNAYHVFYLNGSSTAITSATVIDGVTVTAGRAYEGGNAYGGAMLNESSSSPTLANVTFTGNSAIFGGAMYNRNNSNPTLTNVVFLGNSASFAGGAMQNLESSPTLIDVTFTSNSTTDDARTVGGAMANNDSNPVLTNVTFENNSVGAVGDGGAMFNSDSNPVLTDVTFRGNSASFDGGAIYNRRSDPTLTNVIFESNSASVGGAIYNRRSDPTLTNVIFESNSASSNGGAMSSTDSNPTLVDVTFLNNSARDGGAISNSGSNSMLVGSSLVVVNATFTGNLANKNGGALYNSSSSDSMLTNALFTENSAESGGAIRNDDGIVTLVNSTVFGNTAANQGGGVRVRGNSTTLTILRNTIVVGNSAATENDLYAFSTVTPWDGSYNIIGDSDNTNFFVNGTDGNVVDSTLSLEAVFVDSDSGDLQLKNGSPAIDAGDNRLLPMDVADLDDDNDTAELLPLDVDGNVRIVDGDSNGTAIVDIGSYEFQP